MKIRQIRLFYFFKKYHKMLIFLNIYKKPLYELYLQQKFDDFIVEVKIF